ncbi:restriction endonuclease subunit S [Lysinibacillus sp. OTC-L20]|uniref:restriction endonuclease subunit S n=1 Tax=Lysinibacillus sp. OTC-L20 TaxID=3342791 RepID=UPI0035BA43FB
MAVPKLRFEGFCEEWIEAPLGDIYEFKNGLNKEKEAFGKGTPIINYMDVNKNTKIDYHEIKGKVELTNAEIERFIVKNNDLFFTRTSESAEEIGLTCAYNGPNKPLVFSGFILKATPRKQKVNSTFFAYYLRTGNLRNIIIKHSSITTRALTSGTLLSSLPINLPILDEQNRIANLFMTFDKKIQLQQEKIDLLKEQKKGFMQKIFNQELRFKNEEGQEFPKWTTNILTHFAVVNPKSEQLSKEFRYIDLEAVVDGELLTTQVILKQNAPSRAQRVVGKGDILYQTVRPYQKNNLLYNHDFTEQVVASTGYAQIKAKENTDVAFLYQLMNTEKFTYHVLQRCTGTSYPAINSSDLGEIEVQMPVLKEQQKIASFLSKLDEKIASERNKLKALHLQKQAFMQQMFI